MRFQNINEYSAALAYAVADRLGVSVKALSGVSCSAYVANVRFSDHSDFVQRGESETIRIDGTYSDIYSVMNEDGDLTYINEDEIEEYPRDLVEYAGIEVDDSTFKTLVDQAVSMS